MTNKIVPTTIFYLILVVFLSLNQKSYAESWIKTVQKTETEQKEYTIYSLISENKHSNDDYKVALIMTSIKKNTFNKIGFVKTSEKLSCNDNCQYYIKFNQIAAKYSFTQENDAIKLNDKQQEDFLKNITNSTEMVLLIDNQKYFFNVSDPNWQNDKEVKK